MQYTNILASAVLACCATLYAHAQGITAMPSTQSAPPGAPTSPVRDRGTAKGTAVVKGQLLDVTTGAPIRRARVSLSGGGGNVIDSPTTQTDSEGRFEFRELAAGKYMFNATKTGYLSLTSTNYGKRVPPLPVGEGETIDKIVLRLARGGVVSGQVLDDFGEAIAGAEVRVMRYRYVNGARQLMPSGANGFPVATDDLGNFRVYGLEPGEYYVLARPARDFGPPAGGSAETDGPAPTYYPGTTSIAEARRIAVRPGRETQGIAFQVAVARLARVRGRVLSSTGESFAGNVSVLSTEPMIGGQAFSGSAFVRPDGTFEVVNLAPGSYTLVARQNDFGSPSAAVESGRALISVNGEALNDIVITTSRGGTIRGRVTTDEGTSPPFAAGSFTLFAQPVDSNAPPAGRSAMTKAANDWTFEMTGIFDRVHLRPNMVAAAPAGSNDSWSLKAVLSGGEDISDTGIEVRPGHVLDDVVIVYTRKQSRLTGRLLDDRGEAAEGWIVLFSADESLWKPQSRFVRPARPGPDGVFRIQATPHDNYLVIGVAALEDGQWQDPEFLRSVKDLATRLSIGENETRTQDVKLTNRQQ